MHKQVFIHIGTEKTGTTSVQRFLEINEEILLTRGVHFSRAAGRRQNWKLPLIVYSRPSDDIAHRLASQDKEFAKKRDALADDIRSELVGLQGNKLVFSSELLQSRLSTTARVNAFAERLKTLGISKPKIIIYLREPAALANSLYSTALRAGSTLTEPPAPGANPYFDNVCNHQATLDRWSSAFGRNSLEVRLFRPDRLKNRSVIDDFCSILQIDPRAFQMPEEMNRGLSKFDAALLLRLNRAIPARDNGQPTPIRANLEAFFRHREGIPAYRMPNLLWSAFREYYSESNEWVRSRFFPSEDALFPAVKNNNLKGATDHDNAEPSEAVLAAMTELLKSIWLNKQGIILDKKQNL